MTVDEFEQSILDELKYNDGQSEGAIKMHLGLSQSCSIIDTLTAMAARKLVRCDGADLWWLVKR